MYQYQDSYDNYLAQEQHRLLEEFMSRPNMMKADLRVYRNPKTPLTVEQALLRKQVYDQIIAEPEHFNMGFWENSMLLSENQCGTTRCLAGWAQWFVNGEVNTSSVKQDAIDALGLTREEYYDKYSNGMTDESTQLFHVSDEKAVVWMKRLMEDGLKEIGVELDDCEKDSTSDDS